MIVSNFIQAKLPSLTVAGLGWFTDLTIADPYCILPVLSCTTLHLMIRFGGASSEVGANSPSPTVSALTRTFFHSLAARENIVRLPSECDSRARDTSQEI